MRTTQSVRSTLALGLGFALLTAGLSGCTSSSGGVLPTPGETISTSTNTDPVTGIVYSAPITILKGGTYSGNWQSLLPDLPAVTISTSEPVIIENSNIRGKGTLIRSRYVNANVTVRNTSGIGLNPGVIGKTPGYFLHLENFQNAVIENNQLDSTAGMYFYLFNGSAAKGQTIKILRNRAKNIDGRRSTGPDSFSSSEFYRVQFAQFNAVRNIENAEIAWNEIINEPGKSRVEENINMYLSSGTASSPILIHDNYIQGAYPADPTDPSYAGGGIMLGDGRVGGQPNLASAYLRAYGNQMVSTGNQGIAIAAGHDNAAYDNRVVSSGLLPDGTSVAAQNVGLIVWDTHGDKATNDFYNNVMYDNTVGWARLASATTPPWRDYPDQNPYWFPDCPPAGSPQTCSNNKVIPGPITLEMEAQELLRWQSKLKDSSVNIGPQ